MIQLLLSALLFFAFTISNAAQKEDFWYKVESEKEKTKTDDPPSYPYDSLENTEEKKVFREVGFWPNSSNLSFGGGFFADEEFFKNSKTNRWFINSDITFRNRAWHRLIVGGTLIQNNSFLFNLGWQYTPSRKPIRTFYGLGLAHLLYSEDEFRSLLVSGNYFVTASTGIEILQKSQRGWRGELKAYVGSGTYAVHFLINYIVHL